MTLKGIVVGHNTGLGDQIIMNGAVRYLAECYDKVWYVTWTTRDKHARFLYKNCSNIEVYIKPRPASTRQSMLRLEAAHKEIVEANPEYKIEPYKRCFWSSQEDWKRFAEKFEMGDTIFPRVFYKIMGVDYSKRFKYQKIPRDFVTERKLYERVNPKKPYAFCVNDSRSSKYNFKFETDLQIINPLEFDFWGDTMIYDWQFLIENAAEIHMVNTSWFHLAKTLRSNVKKKFYYAVRNVEMCEQNDEFLNDEFDSGWTLIRPENTQIKTKSKWWLK